MGAAARYAYLHGRTSVLAARLFSASQLESLIQLPLGQEGEVLQAERDSVPPNMFLNSSNNNQHRSSCSNTAAH